MHPHLPREISPQMDRKWDGGMVRGVAMEIVRRPLRWDPSHPEFCHDGTCETRRPIALQGLEGGENVMMYVRVNESSCAD